MVWFALCTYFFRVQLTETRRHFFSAVNVINTLLAFWDAAIGIVRVSLLANVVNRLAQLSCAIVFEMLCSGPLCLRVCKMFAFAE